MKKRYIKNSLLGYWIPLVESGIKPKKEDLPPASNHLAMLKNFERLKVRGGLLWRDVNVDGDTRTQIILPTSKVATVLTMVHDDLGHQGRDRTLSLARDRFY